MIVYKDRESGYIFKNDIGGCDLLDIDLPANTSFPVLLDDNNSVVDNSEAIQTKQRINESKAYLKDTDWYYARKLEINEEVPVDVVNKRTEARNYLRANGY